MEFCGNTPVFYLKTGKVLVTAAVPHPMLFSNRQRYSLKDLGDITESRIKGDGKMAPKFPFI